MYDYTTTTRIQDTFPKYYMHVQVHPVYKRSFTTSGVLYSFISDIHAILKMRVFIGIPSIKNQQPCRISVRLGIKRLIYYYIFCIIYELQNDFINHTCRLRSAYSKLLKHDIYITLNLQINLTTSFTTSGLVNYFSA